MCPASARPTVALHAARAERMRCRAGVPADSLRQVARDEIGQARLQWRAEGSALLQSHVIEVGWTSWMANYGRRWTMCGGKRGRRILRCDTVRRCRAKLQSHSGRTPEPYRCFCRHRYGSMQWCCLRGAMQGRPGPGSARAIAYARSTLICRRSSHSRMELRALSINTAMKMMMLITRG